MKYIVFDTEFTSWKGSMERGWCNKDEHRELIQISALKIETGLIVDSLDIYVKPNITELSDYFTKLTGITNDYIEKNGIHAIEALKQFYKFSDNCTLYSYGNDYEIIEENLLLNYIPFSSELYTKKWFYQFKDFKELLKNYNINTENYTSGTIYKAFNLEIDNHKIHNAMNDVYSLYLVSKIVIQ